MNFFGTTSTTIPSGTASYDPNSLYFVEKFPILVGFEGILIILIIIAALFIIGFFKLKKSSENKSTLFNEINILNKIKKSKLAIFVVFILAFLGTFGYIHYLFSETLFFILCYLFYDITKNLKMNYIQLNLLFFAWFMTFFIFQAAFIQLK